MPSTTNQIEQDIESLFAGIFKGIGMGVSCFFSGFYELRKTAPRVIFIISLAIPAVMLAVKHFWDLGENLYILCAAALPVAVLITLGGMRMQKQTYYRNLFEENGFKGNGKNGRAPTFVGIQKGDNSTILYFKSTISLFAWKKNIEGLQTLMDCKILSIEQGKSKRIVKLECAAPDYDIGDMLPWKPEFASKILSEIVLGESIYGKVKFDFNKTPHWLIAGATNCGKSVVIRSIVFQCRAKNFKIIIMDLKRGVEFKKYRKIGVEVVLDKKESSERLQWLVEEMYRRLDLITDNEANNIDEYNKQKPEQLMQRYIIVIDELAIMLLAKKLEEDKKYTAISTGCLEEIAILGRAAGLNFIFGIQRPDAQTVSGQIKSNVTGRMSGYFQDAAPSLIVLNNTKATELPSQKKGRFMFQDGGETIEFQGYYVNEKEEIEKILNGGKQATNKAKPRWLAWFTRKAPAADALQATQNREPEASPAVKPEPKKPRPPIIVADYDDC